MGKSVSVIIPAYNEEKNIEEAIASCFTVLPALCADFEVIAVNDGSVDKTGDVAEALKSRFVGLKVYHHPFNQGMGQAIRTGIFQAEKELIFTTCADLQFDIKELENLLALIDGADMVIGSRKIRYDSSYRRVCTFIYHLLLKLLFGLRFADPTWVKLFKKSIYDKIAFSSQGFFWEAEILVNARRNNYLIKEAEVYSRPRKAGKSSGANPLKHLEIIREMLVFRMNNN